MRDKWKIIANIFFMYPIATMTALISLFLATLFYMFFIENIRPVASISYSIGIVVMAMSLKIFVFSFIGNRLSTQAHNVSKIHSFLVVFVLLFVAAILMLPILTETLSEKTDLPTLSD